MTEQSCRICGADESDHYDGVQCPIGGGMYGKTTFTIFTREHDWAIEHTPTCCRHCGIPCVESRTMECPELLPHAGEEVRMTPGVTMGPEMIHPHAITEIPDQARLFNQFADLYTRESWADFHNALLDHGLHAAVRAAQAAAYQQGIEDAGLAAKPCGPASEELSD